MTMGCDSEEPSWIILVESTTSILAPNSDVSVSSR